MGPHDLEFADGDPQIKPDTDTEFEDLPGWIWTVYPPHSSDPMVEVGHSANEARARRRAEEGLAKNGAFAVVIGPRGEQMVCRRNTNAGFHWRSLFADPLDTEAGPP
jgi:hypothetical protein